MAPRRQILSLREYYNEKKGEHEVTDGRDYKKGWRFDSLFELLKNPQAALKAIPKEEHYNLFYTVALCGDGKREFAHQDILMFDIDGLEITESASSFGGFLECAAYIQIVAEALKLNPKYLNVVFSGNGLHFVVPAAKPILDKEYFDQNRRHYNALCDRITHAIARAEFKGKADPAVFEPRRIMRLPLTENRKEGKPTRLARVVQVSSKCEALDIVLASGLPSVEGSDQISVPTLRKFPTPDTDAIVSGCEFLKWCIAEPNKVSEQQWYGMLSIVPRLPPKGRDLAHEFSKGHSKYTREETETKIDQALEASGPRTCANLNKLWGGCAKCPNFEKVNSPIMIQGATYIKTESTGFHDVVIDGQGNPKQGKPNYEDLRRFFEREHPYVTLGGSGVCLVFEGTHWREWADMELQNFAQVHFDPVAHTGMTTEFKNLVCRTNLRDPNWFTETTARKMNFRNGVLDLETMELHPHSDRFGFRYVLEYDFDPKAQSPLFDKFVREIMDGRKDLEQLLLEYAGYCFSSDDCWTQKAMILQGDGANGKSTYMDVLKSLAGKTNYSSVAMDDLYEPQNRYLMCGKLFNLAEETPTRSMTESALFKNLTGGGEMTVKQLYKQPYQAENRAKLMFACNELPVAKDATHGFLRRMLIVPFDKRFEGENCDPDIKKKIIASELPGIFNRVIEAYQSLLKAQAFTKANAMLEAVEDYQQDIDSVRRWLDACVLITKLKEVNKDTDPGAPVHALYSSYRIFAEKCGERAEPMVIFQRRLARVIPDSKKRRTKKSQKGMRQYVYLGLKCTQEEAF